jgi:hypothetical protein
MRGFISYSQPKGVYGHYVFTILIYFSFPTERVEIAVTRGYGMSLYSCHHCGKWATITLSPSEHSKSGSLVFYRYDNVEPGDQIQLRLIDSELLYSQRTKVDIKLKNVSSHSVFYRTKDTYKSTLGYEQIYEIDLVNWDKYIQQRQSTQQSFRIEEDLIQKTMNAEPITVTELLLTPVSRLPVIEGSQRFIEGELRYVE